MLTTNLVSLELDRPFSRRSSRPAVAMLAATIFCYDLEKGIQVYSQIVNYLIYRPRRLIHDSKFDSLLATLVIPLGVLDDFSCKLSRNSAMRTAFEISSSCSYVGFRRACSKLAIQLSALDLLPEIAGHKFIHRHLCYRELPTALQETSSWILNLSLWRCK